MSITKKIIKDHLVEGEMIAGKPIAIKIDQTLTQDATGTMAFLEFEAMEIPKVKTELSVSYVDHNMLQTDFKNPDDHLYLQTAAKKFGVYYSKPGNGICHQVHLERFARPGKTMLGSDSHTPTCGGIGSLAIGAGGLDVAVAMGGGAFYVNMPKVVGVKLNGKLPDWVSGKDIILEMLRRFRMKGGRGKVYEYYGEGVKHLTVHGRATVTNMGAELGATTSIFQSDEITREFMKMEGREDQWVELMPSGDESDYDELVEINLDELEPLVAKPHNPDEVVPVQEVEGVKLDQIVVGSCTNSSYHDMMTIASVLKGKKISNNLSFSVVPGSKQIYVKIAQNGALAEFISSGARILESACGPCIGMGQAPPSGGASLRTFNRNFKGRCGTQDANVYLCSPEIAAASAATGVITDPRKLGKPPEIEKQKDVVIDDSMIIKPNGDSNIEIRRGPNIKPLPQMNPFEDKVEKEVLIKVGDNVTTDHIMPAGAKILPLRSNIPAISEYVYINVDPDFVQRCKDKNGGIIIGGENYGQGSSREHAAIAPLYLGIRAVLVKTFSRIHRKNLINFGILPALIDDDGFGKVDRGDKLEISGIRQVLESGAEELTVKNLTKGVEFKAKLDLNKREREIMLDGGLINFTKKHANN